MLRDMYSDVRKDTNGTMAGRYTKIVVTFLVVAVGVAAALVMWRKENAGQETDRFFDTDAVSADEKKRSVELDEIRRELQKEADGSSFRVKINSYISIDEEGMADLLIANSAENGYNMQVTIKGADGEKYYESEELAPGEQILTDTLERKLSSGEYPATAFFQALDPETGEVQGEVTVDITIESDNDYR